MKRYVSALAAVLTVIVLTAASARAETAADPSNQWEFSITPYLWLAGLSGDVRSGRLDSGGVEASFSDILDNLEAAFMGTFEARKGRWGALLDTIYLDISGSGDTPDSNVGDVDVDLKQGLYSLAGMYRVFEKPVVVDLLGGVRYATLSVDLEVKPGTYPKTLKGRKVSDSSNWWDGFGGMRFLVPLTERWSALGYFDIGGGGSNGTFQALAGINYQVSKHFIIRGGYRFLKIDADESALVYDMTIAGPFLGLGITF